MTDSKLKIVVWNEAVHEARNEPATIGEMYPEGIHGAIAAGLRGFYPDSEITTATLADPEHGLSGEVLAQTDVLLWWGHIAHQEVADEVVERVHRHVLSGMGLIVLHSGHWSKIFTKLMGTSCTLRWRSEQDRELVWTVDPFGVHLTDGRRFVAGLVDGLVPDNNLQFRISHFQSTTSRCSRADL